ncbi:SRPBCC family protein [Dyadobacter psychrophilus]|uniref:Activator of Hsp90 ATPase homolog 1-like protein n=1 Tax=Dyadobacter psychrophilus TaxID=651661 RepID=A0A1T5ERW5_9BACT|nr:SRPBCC family protein [Dyadobacter psychrophilus]SKB86687.1 Activator of Hsp90 ATPase homolog 1-like protein [Dyadobacter psychrophilus]
MKITTKIAVDIRPDAAFEHFIYKLHAWWPKQYTWSGDKLVEIRINPQVNGLCTEIGPFGFRCDWGRVTEFKQSVKLSFTWQISPTRIPEPDPDKASLVSVLFTESSYESTDITLIHSNFENHGDGASGYAEAMDSEQGWPKILNAFKAYCQNQ